MPIVTALLAILVDAALGIWLGSILFFSFIAAPRVFAVLDEDRAGRVVTDIFPRYYLVGMGLGGVALLANAGMAARNGSGVWIGLSGLATAIGIAANAVARWVLIPRMERAGEEAFARYHRQSVALNAVTMVAVAVALIASHL